MFTVIGVVVGFALASCGVIVAYPGPRDLQGTASTLVLWVLSLSALAGGSLGMVLDYHIELSRWKEFGDRFLRAHIDKAVDYHLTRAADEAYARSMEVVSLQAQKPGLDVEEALLEFDKAYKEAQRVFRLSRGTFLELYDLAARFKQILTFRLLERTFRAYAKKLREGGLPSDNQ